MLEKQEIERIAGIKQLSVKNAEKDYLLELLLFILAAETGRDLVFKGGTALYKLYSLNRFSEDLDFTLNAAKLDVEALSQKIMRKLKSVGVNGRIKAIESYATQKNVKLELRGPLFDGNIKSISMITLNISLKEKPLHEPEQRKIFPRYPDIPTFDIFVMPLSELFAEKVRALLTRDKPRDVYDVWFLLSLGAKLNIGELNKKLKRHEIAFSSANLVAKLDQMKNSWKSDLGSLIIGKLPDFDVVKKSILEKI
ncbi:MAG: nucleotidyl transferase AbiEii/AbiGii toxin family protein [Candidatus Woesearchaeota archaeon]